MRLACNRSAEHQAGQGLVLDGQAFEVCSQGRYEREQRMTIVLILLALSFIALLAMGRWGDRVASVTSALGIAECDACTQRRDALNAWSDW